MITERLNKFIDNLVQKTEEEIAKGQTRSEELVTLKKILQIPYHCTYPYSKCENCIDPDLCASIHPDEASDLHNHNH